MGEKIPERQLRPLASLTNDERREVWAEATEQAEVEHKKLTAKRVQEAADVEMSIGELPNGQQIFESIASPSQRAATVSRKLLRLWGIQGRRFVSSRKSYKMAKTPPLAKMPTRRKILHSPKPPLKAETGLSI